jgi:predicted HTH transcriptional regulator
MEQVIAKTVCGFLNADGGTLLIGVDDEGTPLGLDADLAVMKFPDVDRYQLWLRDLLSSTLGRSAAGAVEVEFSTVPEPDGPLVCRVTCPSASRPTYLRATKTAEPEFWLRIGNSTRQLDLADATDYVMHRWPLALGANLAAQVKAAVRFSDLRE